VAQDNVDVIQGAWDAFAKGDIESSTSIVAPEGEITAASTLPWGGTYMGPEGLQDFLRELLKHFKEFKATPEKVLGADDDHVVVTTEIRGRTTEGASYEGTSVWVYKLSGGQVTQAEVWTDTAKILALLDATPAS
jgi:ketosteroid isomerase-like protein